MKVSAIEHSTTAIIYFHHGWQRDLRAAAAAKEGVVWAPHKEDAIVALDHVGNAEACPVTQVHTFEIVSSAYPLLDAALSDAYADDVCDSYETLHSGRDVKKQTDIPTVLVDRIVRDVATEKLKHFRGRGKPS